MEKIHKRTAHRRQLKRIRLGHGVLLLWLFASVTQIVVCQDVPEREHEISQVITKESIATWNLSTTESAIRRGQHFISQATLEWDASTATVSAYLVPDPTDNELYCFIDLAVLDGDGSMIGELKYREEYGCDINEVAISTTVDIPPANSGQFLASSYAFIEDLDDPDDYLWRYAELEFGHQDGQLESSTPKIQVAQVGAPVDRVGNDGVIEIALNDDAIGDNDYSLIWFEDVRLPLQGSIEISDAFPEHFFNVERIESWKQGHYAESGKIVLVLRNVGGGCDLANSTETAQADMSEFWRRVTLDDMYEPRRLTWDMSGESLAAFDRSCRYIERDVGLNLVIGIPTISDIGDEYIQYLLLSSPTDGITPDFEFAPMYFTND